MWLLMKHLHQEAKNSFYYADLMYIQFRTIYLTFILWLCLQVEILINLTNDRRKWCVLAVNLMGRLFLADESILMSFVNIR